MSVPELKMEMKISEALQRSDVWRGDEAPAVSAVSSGFVELDALLPGGGFPVGALTEIVTPRFGIGELRLVLPAVARLTKERWLALVAPPYVPYSPALARAGIDLSHVLVVHANDQQDMLWSVEQALRNGTCGAVLAWPKMLPDFTAWRRLQLAAEAGGALGMLYLSSRNAAGISPAALRLRLEAQSDGLAVHVAKRRGGWPTGPVNLDWSALRQGRRVLSHEVSPDAMAVSSSSLPAARGLYPRELRA
jgi:cell division inhibitor SulA